MPDRETRQEKSEERAEYERNGDGEKKTGEEAGEKDEPSDKAETAAVDDSEKAPEESSSPAPPEGDAEMPVGDADNE